MKNFNTILHGDSLRVLKSLPNEFVDCVITSPPYWGLRSYTDSEHEIGKEKNFKDFVTTLCDIFDEVKRVLKPTGSCWVNLGDTYGGSGAGTTK